MLHITGRTSDLRRGFNRRDSLKVAFGGSIGLLSESLISASSTQRAGRGSFGRAKACIFIYLFGGPSQLDIWDMKPDAPEGIRGEFRPIDTNVHGIRITEHLPRLARMADRYAVVRSLTHGDASHGSAGHRMMTGRNPRAIGEIGPHVDDFPHLGSVVAQLSPKAHAVAPFVSLPQVISTSTNIVPGQNAGFLGRAIDPLRLETTADRVNFSVPMTTLPAQLTAERLRDRAALLESLGKGLDADPTAAAMAELYRRAFRFVGSVEAARAFRIDREPAVVRERYGRNVFGQSLLLARRLVESGVKVVSVCWPDRTEEEAFINNGSRDSVPVPMWDTHGWRVGKTPNFPILKDQALPCLDVASSALLEDLAQRGLLEETLVVWTGEFGRSPKVNGDAGRDHYGNVFSAMLAGGGIRGGQVYGTSDRFAAFPADNPVRPAEFMATLYHCLGVGPDAEVRDRLNRPIFVRDAEPVRALLT